VLVTTVFDSNLGIANATRIPTKKEKKKLRKKNPAALLPFDAAT
jgi:hypothetical protein